MMLSNKTSDHTKSPVRIKQDGKFYSRILSKESSLANPSFRVVPGSVPFQWESKPGTPKVTFSVITTTTTVVPPITPPPSYQLHSNAAKARRKKKKKNRVVRTCKLSFFAAIFRWFSLRKSPQVSSSSRSMLSVSSSSSLASFCPSESESSSCMHKNFEDSDNDDSRRSFLCFRVRRAPKMLFVCNN